MFKYLEKERNTDRDNISIADPTPQIENKVNTGNI